MVRRISFRATSNDVNVETQSTVLNIDNLVETNREFKKNLWNGVYMQLTVMSIPVGEDIGMEVHTDLDQFIKVESGRARVLLGTGENEINYEGIIDDDDAVIIAADTWHNVINLGDEPLKLFSIYAPPHHKN